MSAPARGSSSSRRGSKHGTHSVVTQTCYETRGTQRERAAQGNHGATASTSSGDQHSLPLFLEDLSKIAELIVRQLPINLATDNNTTQTTAAVLVPPILSPAVTVVQSSPNTTQTTAAVLVPPISSPVVTVVQSSPLRHPL